MITLADTITLQYELRERICTVPNFILGMIEERICAVPNLKLGTAHDRGHHENVKTKFINNLYRRCLCSK